MSVSVETLLTPGEISRLLGERQHRVTYVISSRNVKPVRRAGIVRLFSPEATDQIRRALAEIDATRTKTTPSNDEAPGPQAKSTGRRRRNHVHDSTAPSGASQCPA